MTDIDLEFTPILSPITDVRLHNSLSYPAPISDTPATDARAALAVWSLR